MCIGNFVVVEFGMTGNACYIFRRDQLPFGLDGDLAGNSTALKHASFVERLLHKDGTFLKHGNASLGEPFVTDACSAPNSADPERCGGAICPKHLALVTFVSAYIQFSRRTAKSYPARSNRSFAPVSSRSHDETPPAHGIPFTERELSRLCDTRRLRIEDLRDRNGNLWVLTGDVDGYVSGQLRSWGFSFKAGKGWWRK